MIEAVAVAANRAGERHKGGRVESPLGCDDDRRKSSEEAKVEILPATRGSDKAGEGRGRGGRSVGRRSGALVVVRRAAALQRRFRVALEWCESR